MFKRLQEKWGVSTRQFWILFIIFGLTGCTAALLTRYIAAWLGMDDSSFWLWKFLLRAGMLLLGYQFLLLGYGALLGQWAFFWKYEKKLLIRLGVWRLAFVLVWCTAEGHTNVPNPKPCYGVLMF